MAATRRKKNPWLEDRPVGEITVFPVIWDAEAGVLRHSSVTGTLRFQAVDQAELIARLLKSYYPDVSASVVVEADDVFLHLT